MPGYTNVRTDFPDIFTEYELEEDKVNGKVSYESMDGKHFLSYCGEFDRWLIPPKDSQ